MLCSSVVSSRPTSSLVTIHEVKALARIDSGHEDEFLAQCIEAAELSIEHMCRRSFRPQAWTAYYSDVAVGKPEPLPRSPVASVVVSYRNTPSTWAVAAPSLLLDAQPSVWYPPAAIVAHVMDDRSPNWKAVTVCGADPLETPVKHAIVMLASHFFEQRSPIIVGHQVEVCPMAIDSLIAPYKINWN